MRWTEAKGLEAFRQRNGKRAFRQCLEKLRPKLQEQDGRARRNTKLFARAQAQAGIQGDSVQSRSLGTNDMLVQSEEEMAREAARWRPQVQRQITRQEPTQQQQKPSGFDVVAAQIARQYLSAQQTHLQAAIYAARLNPLTDD